PRGNFARDADFGAGQDGGFVAGDAGRGPSLIVWALAEGRAAAAAVDRYLMSSTTLPAPVAPPDRPLAVWARALPARAGVSAIAGWLGRPLRVLSACGPCGGGST